MAAEPPAEAVAAKADPEVIEARWRGRAPCRLFGSAAAGDFVVVERCAVDVKCPRGKAAGDTVTVETVRGLTEVTVPELTRGQQYFKAELDLLTHAVLPKRARGAWEQDGKQQARHTYSLHTRLRQYEMRFTHGSGLGSGLGQWLIMEAKVSAAGKRGLLGIIHAHTSSALVPPERAQKHRA